MEDGASCDERLGFLSRPVVDMNPVSSCKEIGRNALPMRPNPIMPTAGFLVVSTAIDGGGYLNPWPLYFLHDLGVGQNSSLYLPDVY